MTSRARSLPLLSLLLVLASALLLAGCGGGSGEASAGGAGGSAPPGFPVTVTNCGVTTTYEHPPKRAVSLNQQTTEILLSLGLEGSMAGTAYLDDRMPPDLDAAYRRVKVLAKEYPSEEALLSAEPDFVYGGFTSAFDEKAGRGRGTLAKAGIDTYLSTESCPRGPVTAARVEDELRTIGKIFGVPDRAERRVAEMRAGLAKVRDALGGAAPVKVAVYDSGDKTVFTSGGAGLGNELIKLAGGTNLFSDLPKAFGDVSFEQLAERAPDVILIYDYGDHPLAAKKDFLLRNPALKDVPAVRNGRFAVLPLTSTVMGVRVPTAVDSLARQLHPDRFK
ncbi:MULTISPECIES: ABC transporter substrate-binding protein [Actinomadura]|uniref:ABC transporter substrate-binding protein n=1 Tax=Actinomadura yumaensis TaxID=111807 RepID=A0ABW2CFL4_9ACTN|nr:ABC transporter substrate-binding protein [Actinomadura sp. J1-007]MWK34765.1 ABC transporter substrate-binding protein [Actinomadura sp. J1-007]